MILTVALLALAFDDKTEPPPDVKARELKLDKAFATSPGRNPRFGEPTKVASKAELEKAVANDDAAAGIAKQVEFSKEFVLLFSWDGSGRDALTFELDKKDVVFKRTLGRTRDLRSHVKVYAVPKGTKYRVAK